jgi:hypothetical protein
LTWRLSADCANVEGTGRGAEAAAFGYRHEIAKLPQVHITSISD